MMGVMDKFCHKCIYGDGLGAAQYCDVCKRFGHLAEVVGGTNIKGFLLTSAANGLYSFRDSPEDKEESAWFMDQYHKLFGKTNVKEASKSVEADTAGDGIDFCNLPGIRKDKASQNWEAHIRNDYIEYQLGFHGKGEAGLVSAINARKEAERIMNSDPKGFAKWYAEKYPEYTPIDRKARGYSH